MSNRPSVNFTTESSGGPKYKSFRLKTNDAARIVVIDRAPILELTHYIPGVGYIFCNGDYNTVTGNGRDADCPCCVAAGKKGESPVGFASKRLGVHIWRYNTSGADLKVGKTVSGEVMLWRFGKGRFDDLITIGNMHRGDLRGVDIAVRCISDEFQNLTLQAYPDVAKYLDQKVPWVLEDGETPWVDRGEESEERFPNILSDIAEQITEERVANVRNTLGITKDNKQMRDIVDKALSEFNGNTSVVAVPVGPSPTAQSVLSDITRMRESGPATGVTQRLDSGPDPISSLLDEDDED